MNSSLSRSDYQQYRAPRETDGFLIEPSIADGLKQCELSFDQAACAEIKVAGQTLSELRLEARKEVLQLALRYTQAYLPEATQTSFPTTPSSPLFMSGHQPELFHPGVWFKNFLLDELARQGQGIAINFIVDNDLCRSTSIRIPTLEQDKWSVQRVDFDSQQLSSVDTPWELRDIASQETWTKFPDNVRKALPPVQGSEPLLVELLWEFASDRLAQGYKLGHALAAARHQIEWSHGLRTLEVPMSLLARTDSFAKFSLHVLTDLARFQSAYNEQRESYRREHRIKNQAQPVPKLERFHEWLEAPLWIYQETAPERLPLWVRTEDAQLTLSNRSGWEATLESPQGDLETSLQQWQTLSSQGVCLRPRALMTTMFTRMVTSDLFVHGIGGGKYDQVTEGIIQSYFGLKSPPVIVATATKNLPWQTPLDAVPTLQKHLENAKQELWSWQHHSELRAQELGEEALELAQQKQALLAKVPPRGERWEWHHAMRKIQQRFQELAQGRIDATQARIRELESDLRQSQIANSREYSYVLFPESLPKQLSALVGQ